MNHDVRAMKYQRITTDETEISIHEIPGGGIIPDIALAVVSFSGLLLYASVRHPKTGNLRTLKPGGHSFKIVQLLAGEIFENMVKELVIANFDER